MPSDDEVEYLLSRGGLGPNQRERALSAALEAARFEARRARRSVWRRTGLLVGGAIAAAATLVVLVRSPTQVEGFRSKGGSAPGPRLEVVCLRATLSACPRGSLLGFSVHDGRDQAFVNVYADPAGGGERIWYLKNEGSTPADGGGTDVLPTGATVGSEHQSGPYRIHLLLTRRPVSAAEATSGNLGNDLLSSSIADMVVLP